jgi:hypothetical protein
VGNKQGPCGHRTCEFSPRDLTELGDVLDFSAVDKADDFACSVDSCFRQRRSSAHLSILRTAPSKVSLSSAINKATASSSSASYRRYESASKRAIDHIRVATCERPSNLLVWRQTSAKTSPTMSSAGTADQTDEQDNADIVPLEQHPHRVRVAGCDRCDQGFIGSSAA